MYAAVLIISPEDVCSSLSEASSLDLYHITRRHIPENSENLKSHLRIYNLQFTLYNLQFTIYTLQFTIVFAV